MSELIPMFKPFIPASVDLNRPLMSSNITFGKYGTLFENDLKEFLGNDKVSTYVNFNTAYFVLLRSLKITNGDEVLVSPMACLESLQPLVAYGLKVKFVDVNRTTGLMSLADFKSALSKQTKLVVLNHYVGNVLDIDEFIGFAKENNVQVINDCIESFGAKYRQYYLGHEAHRSNFIFNFSAVRNPNTINGAAVSYIDQETYDRSKIIRDNGIYRPTFRLNNGEINTDSDITDIGYSGLMNEISSYLGVNQLKNIEFILNRQNRIANKWKEIFNLYFPEITQNFYSGIGMPNYWVYGFHTKNQIKTICKLNKIGFTCSKVHVNNNRYSVFNNNIDLEETTEFMSSFLAVPTGWWVSKEMLDLERIAKILNDDNTQI